MNVTIRNPENNRQTIYSMLDLLREAQSVVRQYKPCKAHYIRHWVEVIGPNVRLRVEVKRADGLGDIVSSVL